MIVVVHNISICLLLCANQTPEQQELAGERLHVEERKQVDQLARMPEVMLEMVLCFLNVPDLLHASEACQYARKAALVVLGRDVQHLSFRMLPRHRMERIPASFIISRLLNLQSFQEGFNVIDLMDRFFDEERVTIQLSCLHLFSWIANDYPDFVSWLPPALPELRRLDEETTLDSLPLPFLRYLDKCCPAFDAIRLYFPLELPSKGIAIVGRLLDRCSSLHVQFTESITESDLLLLRKWRQPRCLVFAQWGCPFASLSAIGVERMRATLESLTVNGFRGDIAMLFPSPEAVWPVLTKLDLDFADSSAGALETIAQHCPALTDLQLSFGRHLLSDPFHPLSEQFLRFFAAHLLRLSLTIHAEWGFDDLMEKLSPRLTDLDLHCWFGSSVDWLREVLPRFHRLTSFSFFHGGVSKRDLVHVMDALSACPVDMIRQMRFLIIGVGSPLNWNVF
ncbi:MAG TPA: hypothetical protein V6C97_00755 [Oculatellaceae cyanobacterium]